MGGEEEVEDIVLFPPRWSVKEMPGAQDGVEGDGREDDAEDEEAESAEDAVVEEEFGAFVAREVENPAHVERYRGRLREIDQSGKKGHRFMVPREDVRKDADDVVQDEGFVQWPLPDKGKE